MQDIDCRIKNISCRGISCDSPVSFFDKIRVSIGKKSFAFPKVSNTLQITLCHSNNTYRGVPVEAQRSPAYHLTGYIEGW